MPLMAPTTSVAVLSASQLPNKSYHPFWGWTVIIPSSRKMREEGITIPVVAIGGITREDIPSLKASGLNGIALSGGILKAENPVREMETIIRLTQ